MIRISDQIQINERAVAVSILVIALLQGVLFLRLLPPWQHYDEPAHFERVQLVANQGHSTRIASDSTFQREILASMIAHDFFAGIEPASLLSDQQGLSIGFSQLQDPPGYYWLAGIPLQWGRHLDVVTQLYIARAVSLMLFVGTIFIAYKVICELTPPQHPLRWCVPLFMVFLPPFADIMTAVNNDAAAVFVFSLFLWGATRAIRHEITLQVIVWLVASAVLSVLVKNTSAVAVLVLVPILIIAVQRRYDLSHRHLFLGLLGAICIILVSIYTWGDAAYWYRWAQDPVPQARSTAMSTSQAPFGNQALVLDVMPNAPQRRLLSPVLPHDLDKMRGRTVTLGAWIWGNRRATILSPGLTWYEQGTNRLTTLKHSMLITPDPTFVAWTFDVPEQAGAVQYTFLARQLGQNPQPLQLFLDGAILVVGEYPVNRPPVFDPGTVQRGAWGGKEFTNLVRNPSAEQEWPRSRTWIESLINRYANRSLSQVTAAIIDYHRTSPFFLNSLKSVVYSSFGRFAWGHVSLEGDYWSPLFFGITAIVIIGSLKWIGFSRDRHAVGPSIALLAFAGGLVWINALLRPFPLLNAKPFLPGARYVFPSIIVMALIVAGGWSTLWPRRHRVYAASVLLVGIIILSTISAYTIWEYYYSLP